MNLYKIKIRHCSPKDCKESIVGYFIAPNDLAIYKYIDKELLYGTWNDRHEQDGMCKIYDNNDNVIGEETYQEKMIRIRGEFNDPKADYSDLYYGLTHYGWEPPKEITEQEAQVLLNIGLATVIN